MNEENKAMIADGIKFLSILFFKDLFNKLFSSEKEISNQGLSSDVIKEPCCKHC